jgi:hypothetical protein
MVVMTRRGPPQRGQARTSRANTDLCQSISPRSADPVRSNYVAELCDGQIEPRRGDPKTEALLAPVVKSTKDEGLREKYGKTAETLYAVCAHVASFQNHSRSPAS